MSTSTISKEDDAKSAHPLSTNVPSLSSDHKVFDGSILIRPVDVLDVDDVDRGGPDGNESFVSPADRLDRAGFSKLSAFGFSFAVLNTWVALLAGLGAGLRSGGPSALIWGFVYAIVTNLCLVSSLNEVFAVYPTAGGQYHWSAILSPAEWKPVISWLTAMINLAGWWSAVASCGYLSSAVLITAINANIPTWLPTAGQSYAIYLAILVLGTIVTFLSGARTNRLIDTGAMLLSLAGMITFVITVFATSRPKASAGFVFGGLINESGWDSMVIAWLLGLLNSAFGFLGFDSVIHISEEMREPRKDGPKIMLMTILVSGATGLVTLICCMFAISDVDALLATALGLPYAQIVLDATSSYAATTVFLAIPSVLLAYGCKGCQITAARIAMSLARDGGLPFASRLQVIRWKQPIWSTALALLFPLIYGMVQLGSTAIFNSLIGTSVILLQLSYVIPVILMLCGGRAKLNASHPDRGYNLGRWGIVSNLVACFFVAQSCVIYCFPASLPVTAESMNYVVAFVGGYLLVLVVVWQLWGKKTFPGPSEAEILGFAEPASRIERREEAYEM